MGIGHTRGSQFAISLRVSLLLLEPFESYDRCDRWLTYHIANVANMRGYVGFVIACTLVCGASAFEWKTCAEGKADVSHVSLTPDPPQAGDTIKFSIDAESSK